MSEDWLGRWAQGRTGWHELTGNDGLKRYWPQGSNANPVLVPLCGKTPDLLWLADRGHDVIGVELSEVAVRGFFDDHSLHYDVEPYGRLLRFAARQRPVTIFCGDYFDFDVRGFGALYDRGALVALSAAERPRYIEHTRQLLEDQALRFVITLEYDQDVVNGPPFAVAADELKRYWDDLERMGEKEDIDSCPPKFRKAGLKNILEVFWLSSYTG